MPSKMEDFTTLRSRIQYALKSYAYTVYRLSNNESERSRLNKQINGTTTISADTVILILNAFPGISAEWLLRGEGRMYRADQAGTHVYNNVHTDGAPAAVSGTGNVNTYGDAESSMVSELIKTKDALIASKDAEIASMAKTIRTLELLLDAFK